MLKAAEVILERDGIDALTMRALAREAGVSHAAPAHHFGNLSGLLSELAASGFVRLREYADDEAASAGPGPRARLIAHARGYVGLAAAYPGLFKLMFRSERLNWTNPALANAGASAFALLTLSDEEVAGGIARHSFKELVAATARWSFVHGIAMLLIDGRLNALADEVPGATVEALIEALLTSLGRQDM